MKATVISDKEFQTELFQKIKESTYAFLNDKGFDTELINIGEEDLAYCMGCFGCWVKKPGECVIDDMMSQINRSFVNSDLVIYLSPVVFGHFSANIKKVLDRWLPNILPFFETRSDGSTMHPSRYDSIPREVIIGYGEELSDGDVKLFIDITRKHRYNIEVLIYQGDGAGIAGALGKADSGRVSGQS